MRSGAISVGEEISADVLGIDSRFIGLTIAVAGLPGFDRSFNGRIAPMLAAMAMPYVHPAALEPDELLKHCEVTFGRVRGPGGQNRNKVETAVTITHTPTGIDGFASERRSQYENRKNAVRRLRVNLALKVRVPVHPAGHRPTQLWIRRRQGEKMSVNPEHVDYPGLLAEALDVIFARKFDVAGSAGILGVTMSQLAKLLRHEKHAMAMVNEGRKDRHLQELK